MFRVTHGWVGVEPRTQPTCRDFFRSWRCICEKNAAPSGMNKNVRWAAGDTSKLPSGVADVPRSPQLCAQPFASAQELAGLRLPAIPRQPLSWAGEGAGHLLASQTCLTFWPGLAKVRVKPLRVSSWGTCSPKQAEVLLALGEGGGQEKELLSSQRSYWGPLLVWGGGLVLSFSPREGLWLFH